MPFNPLKPFLPPAPVIETRFITNTAELIQGRIHDISDSQAAVASVISLPKLPAEVKEDVAQQAARMVQHTAQVEAPQVVPIDTTIAETQAREAVNQLHDNQDTAEQVVEKHVAPAIALPTQVANPGITAAQQAVNDAFEKAA